MVTSRVVRTSSLKENWTDFFLRKEGWGSSRKILKSAIRRRGENFSKKRRGSSGKISKSIMVLFCYSIRGGGGWMVNLKNFERSAYVPSKKYQHPWWFYNLWSTYQKEFYCEICVYHCSDNIILCIALCRNEWYSHKQRSISVNFILH